MLKSTAAFTIYNASAGSGKTYTLVKNYLIKILGSPLKGRYKQILAITFTNKAVAEMKERILDNLHGFSQSILPEKCKSMFEDIKEELNISSQELQEKSKEVLHYLLHNYTAFNVQTIDKFTQSVIRTFAFDLNLNANFEIELDTSKIIEQSVDELLNRVGEDKEITKLVVDFMKSNIQDDTAWNIKNSLLEVSKIILNEDDLPHIKLLEDKTIQDFEDLRKGLRDRFETNKKYIIEIAESLLNSFVQNGIIDDFSRNSIPKHFQKLKEEGIIEFKSEWHSKIEETAFYTKKTNELSKQIIDEFRPKIESVFYKTKKLVFENFFILRVLKNSTQMSLLKTLNTILEQIKKEDNILLISDFNQLIYEAIKDQPTPFIYERLGEKFKDFFIDEFQDTSVLQWENLIPLADNAVSSLTENTEETGSVTLVGDAKQAIYRWRGGKAEQFINLYKDENPFSNPNKKVENLKVNFRSYSNIVDFNNNFFTYLAEQFSSPIYKELYLLGNKQKENNKKGGYVQFNFIDGKNSQEKNEQYLKQTIEVINQIIENGFDYKDICVLIRKNSQGVLVANYLNKNNIPVISTESLLLKNSNIVELLISFLQFLINREDKVFKLNFLKALSSHLRIKEEHQFLSKNINLSDEDLKQSLYKLEIIINFKVFDKLSIYEAFESLIRSFKLSEKSSSYLQFFMDFVFEYSQKINLGVVNFIEYWESKKDKLSIVTPKGKNAIQVSSIHKSKGLEFPVVVCPFADTEVYRNTPKNIWLPIVDFSDTFSEAYISYNKKLLESFSEETSNKQQNIKELQELDNFNVLYVALTRSIEQLYIISNNNSKAKQPPTGSFQSYFLDFLDKSSFSKEENKYHYGKIKRILPKEKIEKEESISNFLSSNKIEHGISKIISRKVERDQKDIIDRGILIHKILSEIFDRSSAFDVLEKYRSKISEKDYFMIKKNLEFIFQSQELKEIYNANNTIYNEREFVYAGNIFRLDRVEITFNGTVNIVDYKTGKKDEKYLEQMENYEVIFRKMGYKRLKKYIIYIREEGLIEII